MTPDDMIAKVLDPEFECLDGGLANDLLREFFRGYPVENLKLLIHSDLSSARGTASFIATELGLLAAPLLVDIASLLTQPTARSRYDALSALRACATYKDGWAIAIVLKCLDDPWPGVRMGAIDAVRVGERQALIAGFNHLKSKDPESVYARFGKAFLKAERGNNEVIVTLISDKDPIVRRFGVGLAARPRLVVDQTRLKLAATSIDPEVSEYATQATEHVLPPWGTLFSSPPSNPTR